MSLSLDKRQRAMLREMGVRVWQPLSPALPAVPVLPVLSEAAHAAPAGVVIAIDSVAGHARIQGVSATFEGQKKPKTAAEAAPARSAQPESQNLAGTAAACRIGEAVSLYAGVADARTDSGPRWLVLLETPASALLADAFNPFDGDAGKLLDNMLRAAGLHKAGAAMLAPLVRQAAGDSAAAHLAGPLTELFALARPDVVLVMGRLVSQALLQSSEPFGKLRGRVHALNGMQAVVTHDAAYLLRNQLDKAKAWEDLCLAIGLASGSSRS
jgi:uracil-DNA glycosylase family 4